MRWPTMKEMKCLCDKVMCWDLKGSRPGGRPTEGTVLKVDVYRMITNDARVFFPVVMWGTPSRVGLQPGICRLILASTGIIMPCLETVRMQENLARRTVPGGCLV